ncbi:hypothetical protein E4198_00100 [Streptomyces sp. RKND-216]|uniref:hypothetical protein n=1 Tax=Streptomyces sp. RKND-216 TaxID=2562581 RepID=UPI00109DB172|nr:hypothetical protein [Streptomyces sp. RKND-216]THA28251.1 hypothetical protein E4198_00100 [Streptomyces sp. RKND-216]
MGVKYVISEPPGPTWWARNKVVITAVAALAAGIWIGGQGDAATSDGPRPQPSPTATASGS